MATRHLTIRTYVLVWVTLMGLTALSFILSLFSLGAVDTATSLVIASAKTVLVALFFMHLIEQRVANAVVIVTSLFFVVVLVTLTAADVATRITFPRTPLPAIREMPRLDPAPAGGVR